LATIGSKPKTISTDAIPQRTPVLSVLKINAAATARIIQNARPSQSANEVIYAKPFAPLLL